MKVAFSILFVLFLSVFSLKAQENLAQSMLKSDSKLTIGGYGEVHYNQAIDGEVYKNGKLDVHRMVMMFGYRFNERVNFITELEFEHVKEVYVEQAFLQYKLNDYINFRGGLMLTPMGYVNEYHEPTSFFGVERPLIDQKITPSTWREIGIGITGMIPEASLNYQLYLTNGFNGYDDGVAKFSGGGLRSGRQKGAESYISSPNLSMKVGYMGVAGLHMNLSGYFGQSQSTLYHGLSKNDVVGKSQADSSVIGIAMLGFDAKYKKSGFEFLGQLYYSSFSNTDQYNTFTGSDMGSAMYGYYLEAAYNVFHSSTSVKTQFFPFVRYENYNTQSKVEKNMTLNDKYKVSAFTAGLSWYLAKGAVCKVDMQFVKDGVSDEYSKALNLGIGVMF